MPAITVYVDDKTIDRLRAARDDLGRSIEDLTTSAVEEAALKYAVENGHE